jgi:phospholipase/lecithinase/hemolysin
LLQVLPDVLGWIGPSSTPAPAQTLLKSGDQLAFMGQSLTQSGGYGRLIQHVLSTNYPQLKLTFINAGRGGQVAADMELRFVKDMTLNAGASANLFSSQSLLSPPRNGQSTAPRG